MAVGGLDKINCPLGCVCVCVRAHGVLLWTDVSSRVFFCLFAFVLAQQTSTYYVVGCIE